MDESPEEKRAPVTTLLKPIGIDELGRIIGEVGNNGGKPFALASQKRLRHLSALLPAAMICIHLDLPGVAATDYPVVCRGRTRRSSLHLHALPESDIAGDVLGSR
jgi:hypothetical protein